MKRPPAFHPLLFALYPVVFFFQGNLAVLTWEVMVPPAAVSLVAAAAVWLLFRRLLGHPDKAALLVSLFMLLLFSYGVIAGLLQGFTAPLIVCAAAFAGGCWLCWRARRHLRDLTVIANGMAAVLLGMSVVAIGWFSVQQRMALRPAAALPALKTGPGGSRPDVYYIVLDAYARSDVLRTLYQYDNRDFLEHLRQRGFYVATGSNSVYSQTILSLASSLNLDYIQNLVGATDGASDRRPLIQGIRRSRLVERLRRSGYTFVAFSTGLFATEVRGADVYLSRPWFLNEFEAVWLNLTPVPLALTRLGWPEPNEWHRRRVNYTLDQLAELPRRPGPRFVLAHILSPHPPFVFDEDGSSRRRLLYGLADGRRFTGGLASGRAEYVKGYRGQAAFITRRIREVLDAILARSASAPIILLQSDHGPASWSDIEGSPDQPRLQERFAILNACLLPNRDYQGFYDTISPLNTARLVVNKYFGGEYELLPDESFFSTSQRPYEFTNVSGRLGCEVEDQQSRPGLPSRHSPPPQLVP